MSAAPKRDENNSIFDIKDTKLPFNNSSSIHPFNNCRPLISSNIQFENMCTRVVFSIFFLFSVDTLCNKCSLTARKSEANNILGLA